MNWTDRIQDIYKFLNENGHKEIIEQMIDEYGVGGTPGEQFSIVCEWLAKMRNRNQSVYHLIKEDADEILQEGIDMKYFKESYYRNL